MQLEKKLETLSKIAEKLNEKGITWAVGASLLLYLKGKAEIFNDIDIMVSEPDAEKLKAILLDMGQLQPPNPNGQYKTKHFYEFVIDEVEVDVMAGFVIVNEGKEYYFPLTKDKISDYATVNATHIPLQSLEEWKNYYKLMGREEKVKMIEKSF